MSERRLTAENGWKEGENRNAEMHLNPSAPIGQFMQAIRQFGFFYLDKWVIECPAVELFEAMDCIFEVCYDLKC